ncbi:MAG: hypothetical protein HC910_22845 [Spirulinaceae cyanobacterium SM2_1_0]|nr:hypothetical protein [Spirulinaceae cyanobacterium SM2_1_0]
MHSARFSPCTGKVPQNFFLKPQISAKGICLTRARWETAAFRAPAREIQRQDFPEKSFEAFFLCKGQNPHYI